MSVRLAIANLRRGIGSFGIGMTASAAIKRQVQKHLEESLFYAAANVSLVNDFMDDPLWKAAQEQDSKFLTRHGRNGGSGPISPKAPFLGPAALSGEDFEITSRAHRGRRTEPIAYLRNEGERPDLRAAAG